MADPPNHLGAFWIEVATALSVHRSGQTGHTECSVNTSVYAVRLPRESSKPVISASEWFADLKTLLVASAVVVSCLAGRSLQIFNTSFTHKSEGRPVHM